MLYKKINLFLISVLILIVFLAIPVYNDWMNTKLLGDNIFQQMGHMKLEERKMSRYGFSYVIYQNIAKRVTDPKNAVILMPPEEYLKTINVKKFASPEPATFYYYTGLVSVWANSPDVGRANWELMVRGDQQIAIRKITDRRNLDSIVTFYKKYIH
jgi:hypothetical protein